MLNKPKNLPNSPGVYLFKDKNKRPVYIGKAASLKARVFSYWKNNDSRIKKLVEETASLSYKKTETVIEALILEANLIKKYEPKYNIKGKDNKTFLYILFKKEDYQKPILIRGQELEVIKQKEILKIFGPFTSASSLRIALDILRGIFPWSECKKGKPCFYYQIAKCPGVCAGTISKKNYQKIIKNLILFFEGKKDKILKNLQKEMFELSKKEKFEEAAEIRNKIKSLEHIQDIALIKKECVASKDFERIEGYDISNISGKLAVGSMVVFSAQGGSAFGGENIEPKKSDYRKFRIKTVDKISDTDMIKEVLKRRFKNLGKNKWNKLPNLILIDGGKGQVNAALKILNNFNLQIPVVGIAKGAKRKNNALIFGAKNETIKKQILENKEILIRVRDEAHRFAIKYHRSLRKIKK